MNVHVLVRNLQRTRYALKTPDFSCLQRSMNCFSTILLGDEMLQTMQKCSLSPSAVDEFVTHYNQERNHQGLANQLIRPKANCFPSEGALCRRIRL
jgi:hypothetical protein